MVKGPGPRQLAPAAGVRLYPQAAEREVEDRDEPALHAQPDAVLLVDPN